MEPVVCRAGFCSRVRAFRVTPELLEKVEREQGPGLEFMLRNAHRPFFDTGKVYRIELSDPTLRISYSTEIDRNKLH